MAVLFFSVYIPLSMAIFMGAHQSIYYVQNEFMYGSYTLIGVFVFMTLILLIICNYLIDLIYNARERIK